MALLGQRLLRFANEALKAIGGHSGPGPRVQGQQPPGKRERRKRGHRTAAAPTIGYAPQAGDTADPGEIVWTWVPYEEDPTRGKDRPVLIIGRDGGTLLALMLTSRDRNNGSSRDDGYIDIGSGPWDRQGRPSEVYLDRILRIDPAKVRRLGATLDRQRFDTVIDRVRHARDS